MRSKTLGERRPPIEEVDVNDLSEQAAYVLLLALEGKCHELRERLGIHDDKGKMN